MRSCRERVVFDDGGELKLKGKENLVMSYAPLRQWLTLVHFSAQRKRF